MVYDETMTFVWFFIEKSKMFQFVVLIWGSVGDFFGIKIIVFDEIMSFVGSFKKNVFELFVWSGDHVGTF